jgi:hypothetical protein
LRGHGELEALSTASHLYALGPLEELRGEVSIFDSAPSIARIEHGRVVTAARWSVRACFLVWAEVPEWSERTPHPVPADLDGIERAAVTLAGEAGLDPSRPLPFRIRGTAVEATFHVLDKRDDLPHNPERHEQAKVRRILKHTPVELIGFYSRQHHGIFTRRSPTCTYTCAPRMAKSPAISRPSGLLRSAGRGTGTRLAPVDSSQRRRRPTCVLSARNIIKGKVLEVTRGATTAHVRIDVGTAP